MRTCKKWLWDDRYVESIAAIRSVRVDRCSASFRRCMGHARDHRNTFWSLQTGHSDAPPPDDHKTVGSYLEDPDDPNGIYSTITTVDGVCGVHTGINASEASNHEWGTAPCGDATHVGYLCQIIASEHEWVYESCPSGHAHYECDGSNHSLQASCSETNANGDTCTVTNFYACETHTHQY